MPGRNFMENSSDLKIVKVWFDEENINIQTNEGTQKSHPIMWFDRLWNATPAEREIFEIGPSGDSIHWPDLDEDLSLEGFFTYNKDEIEKEKNEVSLVFSQFPTLNITRFAEKAKIHRSLLASYVSNQRKPGNKTKKKIEETLHQLGRELLEIKL